MIEIGRLKIDRLIMPFQNKHVYCLLLALTLVSSFLSFPDYEFKVFPVETCPLNKEDWNNSSARLNCNSTRLYYCLPNRDLTSLIEFCYPRGGKQLFMAGNCLELAGAGYLNHFSCNDTFLSGCPDTFYIGDEIFKYPKCLAINVNLRCFDSDTQCIKSRQNILPGMNSTEEQSVNITLTTPDFSTIQNILPGMNSTEEQSVNITLTTPDFSTIRLGNNTVGLNSSIEQQEGATRVNFKYSTVLVIALSSVLSISILVLIVLIRKRKIRCEADGRDETNKSYMGIEKEEHGGTYKECEEQINEERSTYTTYINRTNSKPLDFDKTDERLFMANRQVGSRMYSELTEQAEYKDFSSSSTFQGMSPLKQSTNHRQHRPLPSIPTTSEVKPVSIQKRRLRGHLGKPSIPQPRTIINQQSREPPKPSHPRNYSHQQVQPANETETSEAENLSNHIAVSSASETSTTLLKKCEDFVVGVLTIMGADLNSRQLKLSDGNSLPENSPLLQNASSDQLKNSKSGSNMPDDVDKDYSERNDDVMNFQNESRKGRLCPGESRIKEKHWDANQEKTLQTNVYTHPQNWSELESEQTRLSVKRPYDSREGKEEFWMKSKRPVVTATRFASNSTSTSDRLFGGSRGRSKTADSREIEGLSDDRRDMDTFSRDNRPKRRPTIRFERENDRSSTWYDWKGSFHHVQSDRRKKRYRDKRKTRTLPMNHGHEWKSKRENAVMETSFSRDNWQGGGNSPNEENVSLMEITYNPGQGPLGSPPDSQRNWDSIDIAERRKQDSSWSASKHKENRILGFEPQDSLTWNNLALQPNIWQQGFGTQMTSGHLETRVPVMFLVPQPPGMVLTNTSLAGGLGQTEPRFDAYKSTQTQFRRY